MMPGTLRGKRCVVTGATSGIGFATAGALLRLGAELLFVGRDSGKAERAAARLREENRLGAPEPRYELADLSRMSETESLALRLRDSFGPIDALVNCAGIYTAKRTVTPEGLETQFAVNHLAPFLLTRMLLPSMAPDCRIAVVSSNSHYYGWIRWKDPSLEGHYLGLWAYEQSKLANVLFAYELARRLARGEARAGGGAARPDAAGSVSTSAPPPAGAPTVFAVDPGLANTSMGQKHGLNVSSVFWSLRRRFGTSPEIPAAGIAALLSSAEAAGRTGLYWRNAVPLRSSRLSYDEAAAAKLWRLSEAAVEKALGRRPAW